MGPFSVLRKELDDLKTSPDVTVTCLLDQLHIKRKNNIITGTGLKLYLIPETTKDIISPHKRFKKSKIHVTGKSCISSRILAGPVFR